jgi:hypothetical protein
VAAAIERFTVDGFAKASMDAIAEAARVTKGAVYHRFKDKAARGRPRIVAGSDSGGPRIVAGPG